MHFVDGMQTEIYFSRSEEFICNAVSSSRLIKPECIQGMTLGQKIDKNKIDNIKTSNRRKMRVTSKREPPKKASTKGLADQWKLQS